MSQLDSPFDIPDPSDRTAQARRQRLEIFAEWTLTDPDARLALGMPATQKALAELLGTTAPAISQWKKSAEWQRIMAAKLRSHYGTERLAAVIDNLHTIATGVSPQAVQAARTLIDFVTKAEKSVDIEAELSELTDEELKTLYARIDKQKEDEPEKGADMFVPFPSDR